MKTQSELIKRERDIALIEKESAQKTLESSVLELKSLQKESISFNAQVDMNQYSHMRANLMPADNQIN